MRREDVRAIEGITEEQVNEIMRLAGQDAAAAQQREQAIQQQLTVAQQGLAAFGNQRPGDLAEALQRAADLQNRLNEQAESFRFREFARNAAQEADAIDIGDVVALLERDENLLHSTNQAADIAAAVQQLKQTKPHWFKAPEADDKHESGSRKVVVPPPNPGHTSGKDPTLTDFIAMDWAARLQLKGANPALFAALMTEMRKKTTI